jgi:hypothetical protein
LNDQSTIHPRQVLEQWSHIVDITLQRQAFEEYCQHTDHQVILHLWEEIQAQVHAGGIDARPFLHYIILYLTQQTKRMRWTLYCLAKEHHYSHARTLIWPSLWQESFHIHTSDDDPTKIVVNANDRVLTLGERRALARKPNAKSIQKLVYDGDPLVIKHLLNNPRMTEAYILKIINYSHQSQSVLQAIYTHVKWNKRVEIQKALFLHSTTPITIRCILCQNMPPDLLYYLQEKTNTPLVLQQEIQRNLSQY